MTESFDIDPTLLNPVEYNRVRRQQSRRVWKSEILKPSDVIINEKTRLCYLDTCILVNIFLEDENKLEMDHEKKLNIEKSRELFQNKALVFIISPFVMAEFIKVATNGEFRISPEDARAKLESIMMQNHIAIIVPVISLDSPPQITLPYFDFSIKLSGYSASDGSPFHHASLVYSYGIHYHDYDSSDEHQTWQDVTLSGALFNMYVAMFLDIKESIVGKVALQDLIVVSMARGQKHVDFVTSDRRLIDGIGQTPYSDVSAHHVQNYLDTLTQH